MKAALANECDNAEIFQNSFKNYKKTVDIVYSKLYTIVNE